MKPNKQSILAQCQNIESNFGYTFQLEQVYLLLEDYDLSIEACDLTGSELCLQRANEILSNYDYSAPLF